MATPPTYTINTIFLKQVGHMGRNYEEGRVGVGKTIYPGMLIEQDSDATYKGDSENKTYQPHASANGAGGAHIAVESAFTSAPDGASGSGGTVDDAYTAGQLVRFIQAQSGDIVYGYLKTGNNALPGGKLASAGDGTFQVSTTNPMFEAIDTLNNTSGVKKRLRMRKL